jgi:hypothetical protein
MIDDWPGWGGFWWTMVVVVMAVMADEWRRSEHVTMRNE